MAHILAVDDDPDLCTLLKTALERDGHAVEIRTSGVTVTESLCRWADCILLDVMMPGEDGFATCRRIRAITQAPILFLTARTDEQSVLTGLGIGADDYLTKPFSGRELLARLRVMLRRNRPDREPSVFRLGPIVVDLSSRRVEKGKEEIHLTSKEYGILRLLLLHQGKVMTHRQLLREIWGPQHEEDTHYLRVHIAHLRQKLGDSDPENRIIRAESGLGYRIVADGAE